MTREQVIKRLERERKAAAEYQRNLRGSASSTPDDRHGMLQYLSGAIDAYGLAISICQQPKRK